MADLRQRNPQPSGRDIEMAHMRRGGGSGAGRPAAEPANGIGAGHPSGSKKGRLPRKIHAAGESGRSGVHPLHFFRICFRSSNTVSKYVNVLWPFVPVALALHFYARASHREDLSPWVFAFNYIAMVPTANLIGFAGQQLAWKLPKVFGVLLETFLGGVVEIVLFVVLIARDQHGELVRIIRDAILGSILANLLLCLGFCFFVGGLRQESQQFHSAISEVGSGLLFTASFALVIPCAFITTVTQAQGGNIDPAHNEDLVLSISRAAAIILWIAFFVYIFFQMRSHHGLYDDILEADEEKDIDRHQDLAKAKLTLTECALALALALAFVSMHAEFLVEEIEPLVTNYHVPDMLMGLILIPVVEKLAEHLTAVDEAWDNQMNFALAHVLGATLQTALFNAPLIVIIGWGLHKNMDLYFLPFQSVMLVLAVIAVGNFLRDGESNYLEGALCILIYLIIAVAAYYFPNEVSEGHGTGTAGESGSPDTGHAAARMMARAIMS